MPIRSSISKVRERAEKAEETARKAEGKVSGIAIGATVLGIVAFLALAIGFATFIQDAYHSLGPRVDDLHSRFSRMERVSVDGEEYYLSDVIRKLSEENQKLRNRLFYLENSVLYMRMNVASHGR